SRDNAGNYSELSNVVVLDVQPPSLTAISPAPAGYIGRPAIFSVQAADDLGVATVVFSVDGVELSTRAAPPYSFKWDTLAYADGTHTLAARALDAAGNRTTVSAVYELLYQPPAAPVITSPYPGYAIAVPTFTVTGMAEPGTVVRLRINGNISVSTPTAQDGSYRALVTLSAEGAYLLTALAVDPKGASSPTPPLTVEYNFTAPGAPAGLAAAAAPGGKVRLSWSAPSGKVPADYLVYRATSEVSLVDGGPAVPALRTGNAVSALTAYDLPPADGLYYYGVTARDAGGNESLLSNIVPGASDRAAPSAIAAFDTAQPPLGAGEHPLTLTLSGVLAAPPLLLFKPYGQDPVNISLTAGTPQIWTGTLTVTSSMNSGNGTFSFQGTDLAGNVGTVISSGAEVVLDLAGPVGSVELSPGSPVSAGAVFAALRLTEPAAVTPMLTCRTAGGVNIPVELSGDGTAWSGILNIPAGADGTAFFLYSASDGLGNLGTSLTAGGSFVIDTTPPGKPLFPRAAAKKAGAVELTWSSPVGGGVWRYKIYRDTVLVSTSGMPGPDGSGLFSETPGDGPHSYNIAAVDAAGNAGPLSDAAQVTARSAAPAAPVSLTAALNAFGRIELSWQPGGAETPEKYYLYRSTAAITSPAGLAGVLAGMSPYIDTPSRNGVYYYVVTALDPAGNESAPSAAAQFNWTSSPPEISIAGVEEGGLYNYTPAPVFSASDGTGAVITVSALLNGAEFGSGSLAGPDGDYTLIVTASNPALVSSTRTVHFSVDLTSPAVSVDGIAADELSHHAVTLLITASDLRLAAVAATLDGAQYISGVPITADGAHLLSVAARDHAGNSSVVAVPFALDLPPAAPPGFSFAGTDGTGAVMTWGRPASDTAGYRLYKDGNLLSRGLLTETSFADPAFEQGAAHSYEVSAVDAAGAEGDRAHIAVPAVSFELDSYGAAENGGQALVRGFFDTVRLRLTNADSFARLLGPAALELLSGSAPAAQAPSAMVAPGAAALVSAVLAVPAELPDAVPLRATLSLPSGLGTTATISKTFSLAARSPREPVVELFPEPLIRGMNSKVRVKLNNQGSAPLELRSYPSGELLVRLKTPEGMVLAQGRLSQTGNGAAPYPGGYFVAVPAQSGLMLDPVTVFVPEALGETALLSASVEQVCTGLPGAAVPGPRGFSAEKTLSGVSAPPYSVTVAPDHLLYDQGSEVLLTGSAIDAAGGLIGGATVQIGVSARGYERLASTVTDAGGNYTLTFNPSPAESGIYTLWAGYPGVLNKAPQSGFTIAGLGFQYGAYTVNLVQNSTVSFRVNLTNTGQSVISGLTIQISGGAPGVELSADQGSFLSSLDGGQSANLSFTARAAQETALGNSTFTVRVTDAGGYSRVMPVTVSVAPSAPIPSVSPSGFNIGLNAGQSRTLSVAFKNLGMRAWQSVSLSAPALPWVAFQGAANLGDIAPGGTAVVNFTVAPPAGLASQAYASNPLFEARSGNGAPVPVNSLITVTSSGQGNMVYSVINADKPRLNGAGEGIPGAEAVLVSMEVAGLTVRGASDANGVIQLQNVPSGRYAYTVKAAGFEDSTGVETVEPGVTQSRELALPTNVVSYEWTVEPTTIQDRYDIKLGMTFKTDVPAPVVSVDKPAFNFSLPETGGEADAQFVISNQGFISAFNVEINEDESDPAVSLDLPGDAIDELKAGQSVVVPFHLSLAHASCHTGKFNITYEYTGACGNKIKKSIPVINLSAGQCYAGAPASAAGAGNYGFAGGGGAGSGASSISLSVPAAAIPYIVPNPPARQVDPKLCKTPTEKFPSQCVSGLCEGKFSDAGGDPRIPEADLAVSVPDFGASLDFMRIYDSQDFDSGSFGRSWFHSFESRVTMRMAASMFMGGYGGSGETRR
ncbi:MAG: Ig-like domain-containing protein, partial [Elusimicrobiales bacterium]